MNPGDVVAGKYRIDHVLGRGGMAVVYAATHMQLREPVAIKVLQRQVLAHPGAFERFVREARVAMRLRSEHVARVHDIGTMEDGTPFIVMELLRGSDLASLLAEQGPLPVSDAVDYLLQACQALVEAHVSGVVHRDLKPANLFLCPSIDGSPCVKVLDFGVSKLLFDESHVAGAPDPFALTAPPSSRELRSSEEEAGDTGSSTLGPAPALAEGSPGNGGGVTHTRAFLGSPQYMAPEQVRSARDVDARADIWALGVILYELVSGGRPFRGDTLTELCDCILERHAAPLPATAPEAQVLAPVLATCLAKEPADRYQNVRAFAEAVVGFGSVAGKGTYERIVRMTEPPSALRSGRPQVTAEPTLDSGQRRPGGIPGEPHVPGRERRRRLVRRAAVAAALTGIAIASGLGLRARGVGRPSKEDLGSVAAPPHCTTNVSCTDAGHAPSLCRGDGQCVALGSPDCVVEASAEALASPDTVWIGAMFPLGAPTEPGYVDLAAVNLAREDFTQMMSGLAAGERVRPFGVIGCNDSADAMRAARHLVEDVRVPAIIGFQSAAEVVDVGNALLVPNGVIGIASLSTSPLVTSLPNRAGQPRMMWRTTYSSAETARAMARVIEDQFERQLRSGPAPVVGPAKPVRVAFLRTKMRGGSTFDGLLFDALHFNGKSTLDNGADFRELNYDDSDPAKFAIEAKSIVQTLAEFAPHVVIEVVRDTNGATAEILAPLEREWAPAGYRPRYLSMTPFPTTATRFFDWLGTSAERRHRFFGLEPMATTSVNARFVMHYNETATTKVSLTMAPNSDYDAFYLLAYATYALGPEPVTGPSLARAIARLLPPGKPVDVGPGGIFDAFAALRRGENIDLNGATGSMDFDLATGEAPFDQSLLCVGIDPAGRAAGSAESGVVFRGTRDQLEGVLRCP